MSKAISREKPERRPARAAPTTPPAGPERRQSLAPKGGRPARGRRRWS